MSDVPSELDLKFLPDWLREGSGNRYADFEGEREERHPREQRDGGDRGRRGERKGGGFGKRPEQKGGRGGPGSGGKPSRGARGGPPGARDGRDRPRPENRPAAAPPAPPPLTVEFLPEPVGLAMIAKQIKASGRAYPLFGTARLFLERPERHRVRFTSLDSARPLFQVDDGPVSFDRATVERNAFRQMKDQFYREEVVVGEPLKGNFSNVARSRTTGRLLGPTNYHAYQPALRKLYEERFSRRLSFAVFQQEEIEIVTDERAVADWKEQARSTTTYTTLREEPPLVFKNGAETEQHFRTKYLPELVKSGAILETSGEASRATSDRPIGDLLRQVWDKERAFPANLVNVLRPAFVDAGLSFFKHRKRILYISPIRPQRHAAGQVFSEGIAAILDLLEAHPKMTRPQLAAKVLGEAAAESESAPRKAALAADLHYLIHDGHVIEFHDGTLDLPLAPKADHRTEQGSETTETTETAEAGGAASETGRRPVGEQRDSLESMTSVVPPEQTVLIESPRPSGEEMASLIAEQPISTESGAPSVTMTMSESTPEQTIDALQPDASEAHPL